MRLIQCAGVVAIEIIVIRPVTDNRYPIHDPVSRSVVVRGIMLRAAIVPKRDISHFPVVTDLKIRQLRMLKKNFQQSCTFGFRQLIDSAGVIFIDIKCRASGLRMGSQNGGEFAAETRP